MGRTRGSALVLTLAIALAACGETAVPDDTSTPDTSEPGLFAIGQPLDIWTEIFTRGDGVDEAVTAFADSSANPTLFTDEDAWNQWLVTLPDTLKNKGNRFEVDFAADAVVAGAYPDCGATPAVIHHGGGELEFVVDYDQEIVCEITPTSLALFSVSLADVDVAADELTLRDVEV